MRISRGKWNQSYVARQSLWTVAQHVPYKYNRAVVFPGDLYHSTGGGFGNDLRDGRLLHSYLFSVHGK
jgi:hypothetical protein